MTILASQRACVHHILQQTSKMLYANKKVFDYYHFMHLIHLFYEFGGKNYFFIIPLDYLSKTWYHLTVFLG